MHKPRCSKCGNKNGTPLSVRVTANYDYVKMQCHCGYQWESKGESAFRAAVHAGIASYSGQRVITK